ncbi:uncharacterized protein LOC110621047 [Manihot esculenta]|uniref:RING-type E3 ubiquitin transferase n=1 Tax=Manihot esculenta TaxID=3983 RepID=A0A2C9WHY2_MANES|nr:uncharacterized protein LOC110621047 [Manihot esculenta]OAY59102.1 hypothetical protein MANES_01G004200v8 [Manihot esculenta]
MERIHLSTLRLIPQSELSETDLLRLRRASSFQVYINLSYHVHRRWICLSPDGTPTTLRRLREQPASVGFWFDFSLFKNKNKRALFKAISPTLDHLGVDSRCHVRLVLDIMEKVNQISCRISKKRKVLALEFKIASKKITLLDERRMMEGNNGMVPTARKSRILKCVKVGENENCSICMDEIVEFGASMPCGHHFHGTCILKWLENSHYCPVCRFEMPTET